MQLYQLRRQLSRKHIFIGEIMLLFRRVSLLFQYNHKDTIDSIVQGPRRLDLAP